MNHHKGRRENSAKLTSSSAFHFINRKPGKETGVRDDRSQRARPLSPRMAYVIGGNTATEWKDSVHTHQPIRTSSFAPIPTTGQRCCGTFTIQMLVFTRCRSSAQLRAIFSFVMNGREWKHTIEFRFLSSLLLPPFPFNKKKSAHGAERLRDKVGRGIWASLRRPRPMVTRSPVIGRLPSVVAAFVLFLILRLVPSAYFLLAVQPHWVGPRQTPLRMVFRYSTDRIARRIVNRGSRQWKWKWIWKCKWKCLSDPLLECFYRLSLNMDEVKTK